MFPSLSDFRAGAIMRLFNFNKANRLYDKCKHLEGAPFCTCLLKEIGVNIVVENAEILDRFKDTNFVTISNHPYGHIDALAAISVIGSARPDYKVTANFILGLIDTMSMHFITVNPYAKKGVIKAASLDAVKECMRHLEEGHPLGFFPAGTISHLKWNRRNGLFIEDVAWRKATTGMIKKANVPVIPVYFSGRNSRRFYALGLIHWKARYLRLVAELYNKKGKTVYVRFGEPVMPEEFAAMNNKETAGFLSSKIYALKNRKKK